MTRIGRPRVEEIGLAAFIIILALTSMIYGVVQTNKQRELVACNRSIIIETNNALRERDAATIEQATSSKRVDEARRKVILTLVDRMLRGGPLIEKSELDRLLAEYNRAVDQRTRDLDMTISQARSAPVPVYACLNGEAIRR